MRRITFWACLAILVASLVAADAHAAFVHSFKITNNSGVARSDLHLEFTGTGGTATLAVTVNAPGCGAPTVSNPGTPWDIDWVAACVDDGEFVTVQITSDSPVAFSSGYWTPGNVALAAGDVEEVSIPALSTWGLILLALILAGVATIALRRRAQAQGS